MPGMSNAKKSKILVVDDEAGIREFLYTVLTQEGYEVITASDGQAGLTMAADQQPDLILLDINMPHLNGMETCRRLREKDTTSHLRVIMLTGYDTRDRLEESIVTGADDFLGKPVDLTELRIRVRSMLKVKDMSDEVERLESYIHSLKVMRGEPTES